jgi:hypothetical protein
MVAARLKCFQKWRENNSNSTEMIFYPSTCAVTASSWLLARSASHPQSTFGMPTHAKRLALSNLVLIPVASRLSQLVPANATLLRSTCQMTTKFMFKTLSAIASCLLRREAKRRSLTFSGQKKLMTLDLRQLDLKSLNFGIQLT